MPGTLSALRNALLILALTVYAQAAVDPIVIKGSHFFYKTNGSEFFIRGVVYQDQGHFAVLSTQVLDPFSDGPTCQRDIAYMQQLGLNTVRAYTVNPEQDHSECMQAFADAGIYIILDLGKKGQLIETDAPQWRYEIYDRFTSVVDAFQNYTNTLGFFVANEVIDSTDNSRSAAFVKAAARDMKAYMKKKKYRAIPVGYSSADFHDVRVLAAEYLNCGDQDDAIDMLGINLYSWCGNSTFTASGYSQQTKIFQNYSVPVYLSEFGCNKPSPREFSEVQAIYSNQMTDVFSGGIVYQYFQDGNGYGIAEVDVSVTTNEDFDNLSSQFAKVSPSSTQMASYSPTNSPQSCPTTGTSWSASPTLPPTPYARLCTCMMQSLSCIALSNMTVDSIESSFADICGSTSNANDVLCQGVATQPASGIYGAYSMCNVTEQTSWIFDRWYGAQDSARSACSRVGGTIQTPVQDADSDCVAMLKQVGASGAGTVTSTPAIPRAAATDASSQNGDGSAGSSGGGGAGSGGVTTQPSGSSGLSGGAKAGIAIAVVLVVLIVAVLAFLLWRQRRKNNSAAGASKSEAENEQPGQPVANGGFKPELADTAVQPREMDGEAAIAEAQGYYKPRERHEMPAVNADPAELVAPHGSSEAGMLSPATDGRGDYDRLR